MGILFLSCYGTTIGLIAALLGNARDWRGYSLYITIGIAAALLSGLLLPQLFGLPGMARDSQIDPASVGVASFGTLILTALATVMLRRKP